MAASTADHNGGDDIVERALAILDEESRLWAAQRQTLASQAEGAPGPSEQNGDAR